MFYGWRWARGKKNSGFVSSAVIGYMYVGLFKGWKTSIKYVTLFLANFYPLPCHTSSHIPGPPKSTSHISDPPEFVSRPSKRIPDKSPCTNSHSIVREFF